MNEPSNAPERHKKINRLKERIDKIIQDDCWDLDDILLDHNYADSIVFDCIVYFFFWVIQIYNDNICNTIVTYT